MRHGVHCRCRQGKPDIPKQWNEKKVEHGLESEVEEPTQGDQWRESHGVEHAWDELEDPCEHQSNRQTRQGAGSRLDICHRELPTFEQDRHDVATQHGKQYRDGHQGHRDELDAGAKRSAESREISSSCT